MEKIIIPCLLALEFAALYFILIGYKVIHIGFVFACAVLAVLIFLTIGFPLYAKALGHFMTAHKITTGIISVVLAVLIAHPIVFSVRMANAMHNTTDTPDAVVVLGCQVIGTRPSTMLQARLVAAENYLKAHPDVICVVSGGQGENEQISEAQCMYNYLTENGIPAAQILMEDQSTSTEENLRFSKELLQSKGYATEKIAFATDGFHEYRVSLLAKDNGITAYAVSAKTDMRFVTSYWVREWLALAERFYL